MQRCCDATVEVEGKPESGVKAKLGEECDWRASDGLAAENGVPQEQMATKAGRAISILHEMTAGGPVAVAKIRERAEVEDVSWRIMQEAKTTLGIKYWKPKGTNANVWGWEGALNI